jgi:hypothetical protein
MRFLSILLLLACAGCSQGPVFGIELGTQRIQDCEPGSAARPCK